MVGMLCAQSSFAAGAACIPSLTMKETYNDNIYFEQNDRQDDFITLSVPQMGFYNRTERMMWRLTGRLNDYRYAEHDELNNTDEFYDTEGAYEFTERLRIDGRLSYGEDTQPDREIERTGLSLDGDTRRRLEYGGGVGHRIGEKTALKIDGNFSQEDYQNPQTADTRQKQWHLTYSYDWTERTSSALQLSYGRYDFDRRYETRTNSTITNHFEEERDIANYAVTVGLNHHWSERFVLDWNLGGRYTETEHVTRFKQRIVTPVGPFIQARTEAEEEESWAWVAQLKLVYTGETSEIRISAGHDLYPASGRSGLSERTFLDYAYTRRLTETLRIGINLRYFWNRAERKDALGEDLDEHTFQVQPSVGYAITPDAWLDLSYLGIWIEDEISNTRREQNQVAVTLRFQVPFGER
jgi:hypothetical protein